MGERVALTGDNEKRVHKFSHKAWGKRPLRRPRRRCECNI